MKNEIILFTDGNINIGVQIKPEQETVWLTQKQMEERYYRVSYDGILSEKVCRKLILNIISRGIEL